MPHTPHTRSGTRGNSAQRHSFAIYLLLVRPPSQKFRWEEEEAQGRQRAQEAQEAWEVECAYLLLLDCIKAPPAA